MPRTVMWDDIELSDRIGEGQSGSVWRGHLRRAVGALDVGTPVAVKRYKPWVLQERGQIDRIFAEVETGRKIAHRTVMQVIGAVLDSNGHPALVMKYYSGQSLDRVLAQAREDGRPLPLPVCFAYLSDIAEAITCLHSQGVIHRDIKPANVLVTGEGLVVADFGVVRSRDLPEQTTTGAFLGTIRYAAPEYLFGTNYDHRIDLYSFGAIAYELFTNREVFEGEKHWARVIAARAVGEVPIEVEALEILSSRVGFNAASLIHHILAQSRCSIHSRTLDLPSFVLSVREQIWMKSFVTAKGRIWPGSKEFADRFRTAEEAAHRLRETLSKGELEEFSEIIGKYYWSRIPAFAVSQRLLDRLERARVAKGTSTSKPFKLLGSVKEAFALGLLGGASA